MCSGGEGRAYLLLMCPSHVYVGWGSGDAGCQRNPESGFFTILQCFLAIRDTCCGLTPLNNAGPYGIWKTSLQLKQVTSPAC
jgi:hypothetical protein